MKKGQPSDVHMQRDGSLIAIKDMTDSHLINTIKLILRKANEGVVVRQGGGCCPDDFWYDEDHLYGDEALQKLNFYSFKSECEHRSILIGEH